MRPTEPVGWASLLTSRLCRPQSSRRR